MRGEKSGRDDWETPTKAELIDRIDRKEFQTEVRSTSVSKPKLYEISALVSYTVVVLATSEEDAMDHINSWEQCWPKSSDFTGVSDIELTDIRDSKADDWNDEAHEITAKASRARKRRRKSAN